MGDFRKVVVVLAVLLAFAGLAAAQQPFACTASASVPPTIRTEGIAELVGDIVLQCFNGAPLAIGSIGSNLANITIFSSAPINSRLLLNAASQTNSANASEAILMIDDPVAGAQVLCGNNVAGSSQGVGCIGTGLTGDPAASSGPYLRSNGVVNPNVYQGVITSNQSITFFGVPVVPPGTSGGAAATSPRIIRITNVRVNGSSAGGNTNVPGQVQLSVSISGSSSVPVNNPNQIVAYSQPGLNATLRNPGNTDVFSTTSAPANLRQCTSASDSGTARTAIAYLRYEERFGSAFKTRTAALSGTVATQNVPGQVFNNSESGFIWTGGGQLASGTVTAGLADTGTRLKAVFNNVPAGVRLFVTYTNTTATNGQAVGTANAPLGTLNQSTSAVLVASSAGGESIADVGAIPALAVPTADFINSVPSVELPVINGQAVAVWEVVNSIPLKIEDFDFGFAVRYTASPSTNSPAPGIGTVNLSFAPINTTSPEFGQTVNLTVPRFADTSTATNIIQVAPCRTVLLFPYVTNLAGFDTGLAIANTSTDPFGTTPQAGNCTLYPYGTGAPTNPITSPSVASGTVYTTLASTAMPGFQGYVIALCNFQYAHGFAFVSDLGARNIAMGYLALIIPDPGIGTRAASHFTSGAAGEEMLAQ